MRKIGFIISRKENELRRALTFEDLMKLSHKQNLYFEKGYFDNFNYSDDSVLNLGANVADIKEILEKCDVIIEPKIGDSDNFEMLKGKIIFGWIHATQNFDITQSIIDNKITAIAFEKMFEGKRHLFEENNRIAGYAAVFHSMLCIGKKYENAKVAILGNGNTAKGAIDAFERIGAHIRVYKRAEEELFKKEMFEYDIIVNAILWDVSRNDHIIYKKDLKNLKKDAIIIDISCDKNGGIESSIPTTISNPTYIIDGITHYVVDHTPSLLYKDATASISKVVSIYMNALIEENEDLENTFSNALILLDGKIKDDEIIRYQKR